jgi:hypothetical protein
MPFTCKFQLNNGELKPDDEVIFREYVDSSFGKFHSEPVRIAEVLFNGKAASIYSNCPCFPSSKNKELKSGQRINDKTEIGYFSANGEDIPYDRPYAKIKEE